MADISSKVRLVVSDVDGTLVGADCVMGEGIRQLAQLLSEQHIAFTLASGRPVGMLEEYKKALHITLPVVASNGAAVHDGEKFIWEELLPADAVRRTVEEADRMGLAVFLTDENTEGVYRQNDYIRRKSQESGLYKHLIHPEGDEWNGQRLQKLMIIDPDSPGRCDMLRPLLEEEKNRIHVVRYGSRCFEAMPEGCSKGTGVERLARYLGISREEILVIGDNANDLDMFSAAGIRAAVGNAEEVLKEQADYVCQGETVYGVIEAVKRYCESANCGGKME